LPVEHADNRLFRVGVKGVDLPPPTAGVGPIDRLTIARLVLLSHLHDVTPTAAPHLRLLDTQLRDLLTSYRLGRDDLVWRLSLVGATLRNADLALIRAMADTDSEAAHVLERVRAQVDGFERFFTDRTP
jgi:hypothetical protein